MNKSKSRKVNILICGYGEFGQKLVDWFLKSCENITIKGVVEPNVTKHEDVRKFKLAAYSQISVVEKNIIKKIDVIVDCSTASQGKENKKIYEQLQIPAVFQNGEDVDLCEIYFSTISKSKKTLCKKSNYLKIARCSAMSTLNVLLSLPGINIKNCTKKVKGIHAYHFKVSNHDSMISVNYKSGDEVKKLTGVSCRIDVIYLRGISHNGYAYHGNVQINFKNKFDINKIIKSFETSSHIRLVSDSIDTFTYERTPKTLVIRESIIQKGNQLNLMVLSYTPEINFPENLNAINVLAEKQRIK